MMLVITLRLVRLRIEHFLIYLESGKESESVVYPGVVEAVVGSLHTPKVDGEPASENVAEMRGCGSSAVDSCVMGFG